MSAPTAVAEAAVLKADVQRWQRIEAAARAWHAARDDARSGGNWRAGEPARRYDDACDVLAAVLAATDDEAGERIIASREEAF